MDNANCIQGFAYVNAYPICRHSSTGLLSGLLALLFESQTIPLVAADVSDLSKVY